MGSLPVQRGKGAKGHRVHGRNEMDPEGLGEGGALKGKVTAWMG